MDDKFIIQVFSACQGNVAAEVWEKRDLVELMHYSTLW